jgi:hypothetical protein
MSEPQEHGQSVPPPPPNNAFQTSTPPHVAFPLPQTANEQVVPPISGPQLVAYSPPPVASPAQPQPVVYSPPPVASPAQPQPVVYPPPPVASPAQPQPVVVIQQQQPQQATILVSRKRREAWTLFVAGFFCPLLWIGGSFYLRSRDRSTRIAAILNTIFFWVTMVGLTIFLILYFKSKENGQGSQN